MAHVMQPPDPAAHPWEHPTIYWDQGGGVGGVVGKGEDAVYTVEIPGSTAASTPHEPITSGTTTAACTQTVHWVWGAIQHAWGPPVPPATTPTASATADADRAITASNALHQLDVSLRGMMRAAVHALRATGCDASVVATVAQELSDSRRALLAAARGQGEDVVDDVEGEFAALCGAMIARE